MENKEYIIGTNLQIKNFESQLRQLVGNSDLPIGIVYYILNNLKADIEALYNQQINYEYNQFKEQQEKETKEEDTAQE